MQLRRLWLTDFRSYAGAELVLAGGLTVVVGANGEGKTNLLEAVAYLATLSSFRGAPNEAMVRQGASRAVVRGEGERAGRALLIEAEIPISGRGRVTVNRQPLRRNSDLLGALRVTAFSPDDLEMVAGGPAGRRRYLDDTLVALNPRYDALRRDFERVLRQRNRLLSQVAAAPGSRGRRGEASDGGPAGDVLTTLEVWDRQLSTTGEALGAARVELVQKLQPFLAKSYSGLAGDLAASGEGRRGDVVVEYEAEWLHEGLPKALAGVRRDELRRGVSLVGPHRDDLLITIGDLPARTHASRGEQRSVALALRLAAHAVVTDSVGEPPLLLLDDVFSELDDARSQALLEQMPAGQALLTTTGAIPAGSDPAAVVMVEGGRLAEAPRGSP